MLIWCLFIMQLVVSINADLRCSYHSYPRCYELAIKSRDYEYCSGYNQTMECLKKMFIECVEYDPHNATVLPNIFTCQAARERNETYPQMKMCGFGWHGEEPTDECYFVPDLWVLEYKLSANKEDWNSLNCDSDYVGGPSYIEIKKTQNGQFYNDFYAPLMKRANDFCNPAPIVEKTTPRIEFPGTTPSGATSFDSRWILAIQASTLLFAHIISSLAT